MIEEYFHEQRYEYFSRIRSFIANLTDSYDFMKLYLWIIYKSLLQIG